MQLDKNKLLYIMITSQLDVTISCLSVWTTRFQFLLKASYKICYKCFCTHVQITFILNFVCQRNYSITKQNVSVIILFCYLCLRYFYRNNNVLIKFDNNNMLIRMQRNRATINLSYCVKTSFFFLKSHFLSLPSDKSWMHYQW